MKRQIPSAFHMLLLLSTMIRSVSATGESLEEQLVGSPLIILIAIIVIDIIAFIYRKAKA
jgi:hypothetical protein